MRIEDEDIRIAEPGLWDKALEDPAEAAAKAFLTQKEAGNIDKAHELGKSCAELLLKAAYSPLFGDDIAAKSQLEFHHRLVLCSYIIGSVIAEGSPDSVLAQTSLQTFYKEIENASKELYAHISDPAAFSLYMLRERAGNRGGEEIGGVYAHLCGRDGNAEAIGCGKGLYESLRSMCAKIIGGADYASI